MNQGDLEEELPLPLNLLMLPSFNVTESGIIDNVVPVLPSPVLPAPIPVPVFPSQPSNPIQLISTTSASNLASKASKKAKQIHLSRASLQLKQELLSFEDHGQDRNLF